MRISWVLTFLAVLATGVLAGCASGERHSGGGEALDPELAELLGRAALAREQAEYATALVLLDSAAHRRPGVARVHFMRGNLLTDLNRLDAAETAYERVLEIDDAYPGAWFKLGNTAFRRGDYSVAVSLYEREEAQWEDRRGARADDAERRLDLARVWLQKGRAYALMNEVDSARIAIEASMAYDSTNATAWAWLGELHEKGGERDRARALYRRAVELEPRETDHRFKLGVMLLKTGEAEEAARLLAGVLRQQPAHEGANYNLAQAFMRLGRRDEAQRLMNRADSLHHLRSELSQAQAAAYQQPDRPDRWLDLAGWAIQAGDFEEARRALGVAHYLNPADLAVQNDMANLSLVAGDTLGAIYRFRSILTEDPTFADGWLNLGVVYAMSGRYEDARQAWRRTLEVDPEHPEAQTYLERLDAQL